MYAYLDANVATLRPLDHLLLDAMRTWALAATLARDPVAALGRRHPVLVETDALAGLDAAMALLDGGTVEAIELQRPCHSTVEEIEAVLLGIGAMLRDGRGADAAKALALVIDPVSAGRACAHLADVQRRVAPALARAPH